MPDEARHIRRVCMWHRADWGEVRGRYGRRVLLRSKGDVQHLAAAGTLPSTLAICLDAILTKRRLRVGHAALAALHTMGDYWAPSRHYSCQASTRISGSTSSAFARAQIHMLRLRRKQISAKT